MWVSRRHAPSHFPHITEFSDMLSLLLNPPKTTWSQFTVFVHYYWSTSPILSDPILFSKKIYPLVHSSDTNPLFPITKCNETEPGLATFYITMPATELGLFYSLCGPYGVLINLEIYHTAVVKHHASHLFTCITASYTLSPFLSSVNLTTQCSKSSILYHCQIQQIKPTQLVIVMLEYS